MFVVLTYLDRYRSFSEALVPSLRTYWGQRGIAVHHMDFQQTAKEAAVAANYHLASADPALADPKQFEKIVAAIWSTRDLVDWFKLFVKRADKEVAAWRQNDLNHIILVTNMHHGDYHAAGGALGPHMAYCVNMDTFNADQYKKEPDPSWVEVTSNGIIKAYSRKLRSGFDSERLIHNIED